MRKFLFFLSIVVFASIIAFLIKNQLEDRNAKADEKEKVKITMMIRSYVDGGWPSNHLVVKELNKRLNIDLNIVWVPTSNYEEKLDVAAASNQFPDVFFITHKRFKKWKESSLFLDVKPYLKDYPNLNTYIPDEAYQLHNSDKQYLGFPVYIPETLDSLVIRKDWLEKLGLEVPVTVEEFYEVAKAFAFEDPNRSGKNDTIGFTVEINPRGVFGFGDSAAFLMAGFGLVNGWQVDDKGTLVPMQTRTNELEKFIGFLRKAYEEGILDQEFPYTKDNDSVQKLQSSISGISVIAHQFMFINILPPLLKQSLHAELVQVEPLIGPTGERGILGTAGGHKIVINANISPKKQQKILEVLDFMLSDEGTDLLKHGIEGIHYQELSENEYEIIDAGMEDKPFQLLATFIRRFDPMYMNLKWLKPEEVATITSYNAQNEKFIIKNAAVDLESSTADRIGERINKKWMDTMVNVIIGKEPMESVEAAVIEWRISGGDEIVKEMNESFQKVKNSE
jgi:putative aldouronate transport system substrate-binding protein